MKIGIRLVVGMVLAVAMSTLADGSAKAQSWSVPSSWTITSAVRSSSAQSLASEAWSAGGGFELGTGVVDGNYDGNWETGQSTKGTLVCSWSGSGTPSPLKLLITPNIVNIFGYEFPPFFATYCSLPTKNICTDTWGDELQRVQSYYSITLLPLLEYQDMKQASQPHLADPVYSNEGDTATFSFSESADIAWSVYGAQFSPFSANFNSQTNLFVPSFHSDARNVQISMPTNYKGTPGGTDSDGDPNWSVVAHLLSDHSGDIGIDDGFMPNPPPPNGSGSPTDWTLPSNPSGAFNSLYIDYLPSLSGDWHLPGMTFSWSSKLTDATSFGTYGIPGDSIDLSAEYNGATKDGTNLKVYPGDTEQTDIVKLSVVDGADSTTATAKFNMRIHRDWEVLPSNKLPNRIDVPVKIVDVSAPGYGSDRGGAGCTFDYTAASAAWGVGSGTLNLIGSVDYPEFEWVSFAFNALGISIGVIKPTNGVDTAEFNDCWSNSPPSPQSPTFTDITGHPTARPPDDRKSDYHMFPHAMGGYQPTWELLDRYDRNGFVGETKFHVDKFVGISYFWGQFVQVSGN